MKKFILSASIFVIGLICINHSTYSQETMFTVTNNSGVGVTAVYLSPDNMKAWGDNLYLIKDKNLPNLGTFTFMRTVEPANCVYDLKYVGDDGKDYFINDLNLCTGTAISLQVPLDKDLNRE